MIWNPTFFQTSPIYSPISPAVLALSSNEKHWPTLKEYNVLLNKDIVNRNGKIISFVKQGAQSGKFEDEYEPRIYRSGEVQTRLNSWHDYFQVMVWKSFPKTKSLLNEIHFNASFIRTQNKIKQRGKAENFVTLFDECGAIFVSSDKKILDLVTNFQWAELFIHNKNNFNSSVECVTFGHAMYEKALKPYIGMTSHCLLIMVDASYFSLTTIEKTKYLDQRVSEDIENIDNLNTRYLSPLPILGIPNWTKNQTAQFYDNKSYFRTSRRKKFEEKPN